MKRLVFLVVALVAAITAASAMAAPAPKATGDYGYSYAGVQRHLTFNAIQSPTNTCGTFWNVTGVTSFTFLLNGDPVLGTEYKHHVTLTQNGQTVGGSGGYPLTGGDQYHWNVTAGSVVGNALSLTAVYDLGAIGVTHTMTGTIAASGSISGTWQDNAASTAPRARERSRLRQVRPPPLSPTAARATPTTRTRTALGTS
jgi:opacity protein-like surface antigen